MIGAIKTLGKWVKYGGYGSLLLMCVIGTFSIDFVLLAYYLKESSKNRETGNNNIWDSLAIGYLIKGMIDSDSSPLEKFIAFICSPLITLIAIVLSIVLEVPTVGFWLAVGWVGAAGITLVGVGIEKFGEFLEYCFGVQPDEEREPRETDALTAAAAAADPAHAAGLDSTAGMQAAFAQGSGGSQPQPPAPEPVVLPVPPPADAAGTGKQPSAPPPPEVDPVTGLPVAQAVVIPAPPGFG